MVRNHPGSIIKQMGAFAMSSCIIRRAGISDLDHAAKLFNLYRQFYKKSPDLAGATEYLNERISKQDSVIFIAQASDGVMAGFAQLYPGFSSLSMAPTWVLNDLYVLESYRQERIALDIIKTIHVFARDTGAVAINLETQPENKKAQALYEKFGYVLEQDFLIYSLSLKT